MNRTPRNRSNNNPGQCKGRKRIGFTLIEVLVVIGIISVLLALLLPAVQSARWAADRISCGNRCRQLAIGVQSYHANHGRLPAGITSAKRPAPTLPGLTWLGRVVPYLEEEALTDRIKQWYQLTPSAFLHPGFSMPMKPFQCPSDSRVERAQFTHKGFYVALTSYVGCSGTESRKFDGVLFLNSSIPFSSVQDGVSTTLLFGERPPSADFWHGWWYTSGGFDNAGSGDAILGAREMLGKADFAKTCPPGPHTFRMGSIDNNCDAFHYWSLHRGGGHFAACDGSVHFLSYSAATILPALATRAGNETVGFE